MDRLSESKKETYRWHLNQAASSQNQLTIARISEGGPRETEAHTREYSLYIYFLFFSNCFYCIFAGHIEHDIVLGRQ